jgi:hypothetical protein
MAAAGVLLAVGANMNAYPWLVPGLVIYGVGLAIVLTVNDPVGLDSVPETHHGQASGVAATAEQGGGAVGIAVLYALFHGVYLWQLHVQIDALRLPQLSPGAGATLKAALQAAEQTGLDPSTFNSTLAPYLLAARTASEHGYAAAFLAAGLLAVAGAIAAARLVGRAERGR